MLTGHSSVFPKGMPRSGASVSIYPSNTVRDLFYANDGRISKDAMTNAICRLVSTLPFSAGWDIANVYLTFLDEDYILEDGDDWVWPTVVSVFV